MRLERRIRRSVERLNRTFERIEQIGRTRLNLPFAQFVALMPYMTTESVKALVLIPPPHRFCRRDVPQDLQQATLGTLTKLQRAPKDNDYCTTCCALVSTLLDVDAKIVASRRAIEVIGIVNMIQSEMERIGKLFQSLNTEKTSDEIHAGIEKLDFGVFGIVDWYAQRMGIVDHEEVFKTPWARIYQCMKIEHENGEFEKRYRKIIENRSKR